MPRYARFFRATDDDATHQKQLKSFIDIGTDQQNFVLGALLFDASSALASLRKELRGYREENAGFAERTAGAIDQMTKLAELLEDGDEEERPQLGRSEDEEVPEAGEQDDSEDDQDEPAEVHQEGGK